MSGWTDKSEETRGYFDSGQYEIVYHISFAFFAITINWFLFYRTVCRYHTYEIIN
jgi:ABC-type glucose/galactose transport system permease subunit